MLKTSKKSFGFTLTELLIAITIMAILAVIGLVSYSSVQKNSRDAIRREQIQLIAQAIEAKKSSTGTYTFTGGVGGDLEAEFPDPSLNETAQVGLDPSKNNYCIYASSTTTIPQTPQGATSLSPWKVAVPKECVNNVATNPGWYPLSLGIPVDLFTSGAKSWTICARLESTSGTSFCRQSLTR